MTTQHNDDFTIPIGHGAAPSTWIAEAWNQGTLTRSLVADAQKEIRDNLETPPNDEWMAELRQNLREVAREVFLEQCELMYEEVLDQCVEQDLEAISRERKCEQDYLESLEQVLDNWGDDRENLFPFVAYAHRMLVEYSRG